MVATKAMCFHCLLSIAMGALILMYLFASRQIGGDKNYLNFFTSRVRNYLSILFQREKKAHTYLLIGMLNGLLPCGLIYVALAAGAATGSVISGSVFMAAFGLGIFPVMLSISVIGKYITGSMRHKMRKALPVFITAMALLLILRGMNLGIPYVSPQLNNAPDGVHACCHRE
jgi:sulfite exporter TauE/SafE